MDVEKEMERYENTGPEPWVSVTVRHQSKMDENIRSSLQSCPLKDNEIKLQSLLSVCRNKHGQRANTIQGLLFVLNQLMVERDYGKMVGFLSFDEAYQMYCGFFETTPKQETFRDHLLHPEFGLCIVVVELFSGKRYILLKSDDIDILGISCEIMKVIKEMQESRVTKRMNLDYALVSQLLASMDTEHDRNVAKGFLAALLSRQELYHLGLKPDRIVGQLPRIIKGSEETMNAIDAAEDIMVGRLKDRLGRIEKQEVEITRKLDHYVFSEKTKMDMQQNIELLQARKQETTDLLARSDKTSKRKFNQSRKRVAKQLLEENRTKRRKLGAGRPEAMGEEEEEFIAKCIADKSTAHGRRHNTTMYLNHRVKQRHFVSLVNYHLRQKGKKLIRSATTVYNRSRPKNVRSNAAKQHRGKWLFCSKKPPKAEDDSVETTHHQRAHVRNAKYELAKQNPGNSLVCSMDDKAYLRPGTDVGFCGMRREKLLDLADEAMRRALPHHDFNIPEVNVTPSSFRFLRYGVETIEDNERLIANSDQSIVTLRPKYHIGSSGSVWASDYVCLRHKNPDVFECQVERINHPRELRSFCAVIFDCTFYFKDTSMQDDVRSVTNHQNCKFKQYELRRLDHLLSYLEVATQNWNESLKQNVLQDAKATASEIIDKLSEIKESAAIFKQKLEEGVPGEELWSFCSEIMKIIEDLHQYIKSLQLPPVCSDILDLTDAGPGVGVSNLHVRFRDAEIARLHSSNRRNRIHRARNDSGQNEAERTNAAIGEAVADGSTIKWDYFKPQDEVTPDRFDKLSIKELDDLEKLCMEKNVWKVCEDLCSRIDGEPGPHGDMTAYVTEKKENQFFWNCDYLDDYIKAPDSKKSQYPGHAYFEKINQFIAAHYCFGELYFEFTRGSCQDSLGSMCESCATFVNVKVPPVRRPYPDRNREGMHYCSVEDTPTEEREIDDYQPRAQLKKLFHEGNLMDEEVIETFSREYVVDKKLVEKYIQHLKYLDIKKRKREETRKKQKMADANKGMKDYDWERLYQEGKLKRLNVSVLDMYLREKNLQVPKGMLKKGKLELVTADIARSVIKRLTTAEQTDEQEGNVEELSDEEEEDIILEEIGDSDSDRESDCCSDNEEDVDENDSESDIADRHEDDVTSLFHTTRFGRTATTWKKQFFK